MGVNLPLAVMGDYFAVKKPVLSQLIGYRSVIYNLYCYSGRS